MDVSNLEVRVNKVCFVGALIRIAMLMVYKSTYLGAWVHLSTRAMHEIWIYGKIQMCGTLWIATSDISMCI